MEIFLLCCKDHPYIIDDIKGVIRFYMEYRPPDPRTRNFGQFSPPIKGDYGGNTTVVLILNGCIGVKI